MLGEDILYRNYSGTIEELLIDFDPESFRYEYEENEKRNIQLTVYLTNRNMGIYKGLSEEAFLIWKEQVYTIKECNPQQQGDIQFKEIIAQHISFGCADHVNYDKVEPERVYTIQQYLAHGNEGQDLGYTIEVRGEFPKVSFSAVGQKSLLDYIQTATERFGGIFHADNKHLVIYSEAEWGKYNGKDLRYQFNTDTVKLTSNTYNLKTYIKGFGATRENGTVVEATYVSPNASKYGRRKAEPILDDRYEYAQPLQDYIKTKILDVPETSLEITYIGDEVVNDNEMLYLIHESLGYESMLNLKRKTEYHPYTNKSQDLGFSNKLADMVDIQRQSHKRYNNMNQRLESTRYEVKQAAGIAETSLSGNIVQTIVQTIVTDDTPVIQATSILKDEPTGIKDVLLTKMRDGTAVYTKTHKQAIDGLNEASESKNGLMSAEDKANLQKLLTQEVTLYDDAGRAYTLSIDETGQISATLVEEEGGETDGEIK
ncbi:prophage endopeptidase tail family protein [Listeria fleischmannii]|uniref:prophage endopeptidase tail family protein n=1 Tax=Listeria fleischmannii TaxID=1069827 RepID=UPI0016243AF6|nr:prophage endopeptidase tail family protein [Listeria fleischmannii]MBC1420080.1 hypothetical protein [Listeria fleischmannii]